MEGTGELSRLFRVKDLLNVICLLSTQNESIQKFLYIGNLKHAFGLLNLACSKIVVVRNCMHEVACASKAKAKKLEEAISRNEEHALSHIDRKRTFVSSMQFLNKILRAVVQHILKLKFTKTMNIDHDPSSMG
eukprot:scaffold63913_cov19-Prasinocladus_malaysianus.AAC.1